MNWISEELTKRQLDEKTKKSDSPGGISEFMVRVNIDGTIIRTVVFAESVARARKLANNLFGAQNVKAPPVKR